MEKTYRMIIDSLRREIEAGKYRYGQKLPSEKELCSQFKASRSSVREALSALEYVGMIDARGGSGYYVTGNPELPGQESDSPCFSKIMCVLEANWSAKTLKELLENGVDGISLCLTGDCEDWMRQVRIIRQAAQDTAGTGAAVYAAILLKETPHLPEIVERAVTMNMDGFILTGVQDMRDIITVRRILDEMDSNMPVLLRLDPLANYPADGLRMVDGLVVEGSGLLACYETAVKVIKECNRNGKTCLVTATAGTNASLGNDVVDKAIAARCDGILLTMLGAARQFPGEAVSQVRMGVRQAEEKLQQEGVRPEEKRLGSPLTHALCLAAVQAAGVMKAGAFVIPSDTGFTPRLLSKVRCFVPIIAVSAQLQVIRRLRMVWGVRPLLSRRAIRQEDRIQLAVDTALRANCLKEGDAVVGVSGSVDVPGTDNAVKLILVGDIVIKGIGIGDGIISGRVSIIKNRTDIAKFCKNKILVIQATEAEHMQLIEQAAALIVEEGGLSSHAAITGLSLQKPVIAGAADATELLFENELITLDITRGIVYRGLINFG
ncbi:transcription regulator hth gntr [Lucifera butyrica]|uniref:Transcription regulator hth gntr n=1 Tax=Lucifera butyrica TaxID=1351585 RepID=A0A498RCS2_9FIRM|nr:pyruvate kinase alpha/beta domain-containing protein [Lucifera butyrica]VBB08670.1 transcription regulator hth gntr [Lucifera butyrica]